MRKKLPVVWLCLSVSAAFATERIYMPYFEMINVHPDYQYSTAKLFKNYVDESGKYVVVLQEKADTGASRPEEEALRKTAKEKNCAYYLLGDMNRMGETVILNATLYATEDGKRIWGDRLKAANPEDLDPILQKLARAVVTRERAAEEGDIYSVTDYEGKGLRQVRVRNSFGVALGGLLFTPGLLWGKTWEEPFTGGAAVFFAYDARTVLFEVDGETFFTSGVSKFNSLSLSAFKPFSMKNLTPFGGGGLGIANAETRYQGQDVSGAGLTLHGGGGVIFNRTSTVQLRLQARYTFGLFAMDSPRNDIPRAFELRMELAFGK